MALRVAYPSYNQYCVCKWIQKKKKKCLHGVAGVGSSGNNILQISFHFSTSLLGNSVIAALPSLLCFSSLKPVQ
jgi:hypothetical protein